MSDRREEEQSGEKKRNDHDLKKKNKKTHFKLSSTVQYCIIQYCTRVQFIDSCTIKPFSSYIVRHDTTVCCYQRGPWARTEATGEENNKEGTEEANLWTTPVASFGASERISPDRRTTASYHTMKISKRIGSIAIHHRFEAKKKKKRKKNTRK